MFVTAMLLGVAGAVITVGTSDGRFTAMERTTTRAPRICLITDADAGIGRAAARQLLADGHRVIIGCRDLERGTR